MVEPKTLSIIQTGSTLRIHGSVVTLIDGFELNTVKLSNITNGTAVVFAEVSRGKHMNIFSSGEIAFDVSFEVPEKLRNVKIVVNGAYDVTLEVTHLNTQSGT